jgi:uncharacterized protein (DUF885 family)
MWRAMRLVVDTGIHAKRWTREQAIRYMVEKTGYVEASVVSEVERYIVAPGQACSYKVGMLKILELRERAKQALGERFDLRAFHDVMLKNGCVPLEILEQLVDEWIEKSRGGKTRFQQAFSGVFRRSGVSAERRHPHHKHQISGTLPRRRCES